MITQKQARKRHRQERKFSKTALSFRQWARKTFKDSDETYSPKLFIILARGRMTFTVRPAVADALLDGITASPYR